MNNQQRYSIGYIQAQQNPFQNINALIHQQWPRLTHKEIDIYKTDYPRFCEAVKKEYGTSQGAIDRQFQLIQHETLYAA